MNARQHDIADALPDTCDWLFSTAEFREWENRTNIQSHNGVLWIKGMPGTGKSSLMKRILRYCEVVFYDHLIVAYFFNAGGETFENAFQGMLQSIVAQLLDNDAAIYEQFVPIYEKQNASKKEGWEWQQWQLKEFILMVARQRKSKPLLFLVDGLDECAERDVRDVVDFLESLSINAVRARVTLRICLSSRHYPHISMRKTLQLVVEMNDEHRQDIATYIRKKLIIQDDGIEAEIRKKGDGNFLWVVLVVSLLNRAYDEGKVKEALQKLLEGVPDDLEEVFNMLSSRDDLDMAAPLGDSTLMDEISSSGDSPSIFSSNAPGESTVQTSVPCSANRDVRKESSGVEDTAALSEIRDDQEALDTATIYSEETTSSAEPTRERYIADLSLDLLGYVSAQTSDPDGIAKAAEAMPSLLQGFARKLGAEAAPQVNRDIMRFVHKHRK